ncbi:hypothetical protein D3C80_2210110 [compost metagenome]
MLPPFIGYHVPYVSVEARGQILADYGRHLHTLDDQQPLVFPSMSDFDDRLMPLAR